MHTPEPAKAHGLSGHRSASSSVCHPELAVSSCHPPKSSGPARRAKAERALSGRSRPRALTHSLTHLLRPPPECLQHLAVRSGATGCQDDHWHHIRGKSHALHRAFVLELLDASIVWSTPRSLGLGQDAPAPRKALSLASLAFRQQARDLASCSPRTSPCPRCRHPVAVGVHISFP